jgi:hypothetical protein
MPKRKPIVAAAPESLAGALGLSPTEARQWQVQHALLTHLKQIVRAHRFTHAEIARWSGAGTLPDRGRAMPASADPSRPLPRRPH